MNAGSSARCSCGQEARRVDRIPGLLLHAETQLLADDDIDVQISGELSVGCRWSDNGFPFPGFLKIDRGSSIAVTGQFRFYSGCVVDVVEGGRLRLGSGVVNHQSHVYCFHEVRFGERVSIGPQTMVMDSDSHGLVGSGPVSAPIVIEDRAWIAARVTILKGVTIGAGAVVSACSLVTADVPPRCLVAGNPARVIAKDVERR